MQHCAGRGMDLNNPLHRLHFSLLEELVLWVGARPFLRLAGV